ncbi:G-box-binding factor 1-like isoform X2 [Lycium barbarum]|uniref:G-box-binding factor 1-like isoform X2 n=1 Tax=Lycium barbarum TaxID=112863 RepID=UPI00293EA4C6|nr:G-box-binding factor 1-like isoform X2 [Lycium barbarum]
MGAGEESTPAKSSKPASTQETPTAPTYSDWSSSMQAYYSAGATPPFFASPVASPAPHPYLWGGQHPLMPPYGTPVPYPALYPPAGVYAHPNMATTPNTAQANPESDGKGPEVKDRNSSKKLKASSGGKAGDSGKVTSGSGNDGATQSDESRSEGTSDTNDENDNHEFAANKKGSFDQMLADVWQLSGANAQNNPATANYPTSIHGNPVTVPVTNLNVGMDVWNASSGAIKVQPNATGQVIGHEGRMNDQWIQDERELKRQKRKQSNRESARRSRLRKQAECEELQRRVEALSNENHSLKDELQRLSEECEKLTSENNSIKEELTRWCGPDAVSKLESNGNAARVQSNVEEAS